MQMTVEQLQALTPTTDVNGSEIAVGSMVRSFDFPTYYQFAVHGMDLTGTMANFVEGEVEQIGVDYEGCPRYVIRVTRYVRSGADCDLNERPVLITPPVNGTPSTMSPACFGVVAIKGE